MRVALQSNVGRTREINEDCAFARPEIGLAILADGMGGHQAGEVASSLAVKTLAGSIADALHARDAEATQAPIESILSQSIGDANRVILARAMGDSNLKGMGTTIVVALVHGDLVYIAHVGDSRAYLFHDGVLRRVTRDHSLVVDMVESGEISEKDAGTHPLRNFLTRTLGVEPEVLVDVQTLPWQDKDCLLLCSDGLTNMVEDRKIAKIIGRHASDLQAACDQLIRAANSEGGKDNITVVLACPS